MPRPLLLTALLLVPVSHARPQGFPPDEAVRRMTLPEGFRATLVASEPTVRQPLSIDFDEKGRLWVLQYLQYPNPAGLKPVKQDQYLRTVWDRVPDPPPHGPRGADRITILSDPDGNGRYRKSKDFVTGLNLATGFCVGHGGVYVVQPPYLLFYPDRNGDDVPDGDPEVLLKGFGMEDTHSYANSLQWGPDGWLYGAHGSTVTAHIRGLEFQQGIWRFHPLTKAFELFSEGGGNTYGLDFDRYGRAVAGTNWGGKAMLHQVQGGYYVKGFAKHGPLHNAHAYGYLDHVPYEGFKGGHVTCGGVVYQGDTYPAEMHDQYVAGNLLSNAVYWHRMTPQGSSFTARHGGDLLVANDSWFRPVDCLLGPDGSVYVADWYDKRAAHLDPVDNWDRTNGRIYRIEYRGTRQPEPFDLRKKSSAELVELLRHPNKWWRNQARRLLAERRDPAVGETLRKLARSETGLLGLEALWALYVSGAFDQAFGLELFGHPNEHVRAWAVRLIGDGNGLAAGGREPLVKLARTDPSPTVRSQLACTAKRLPAADGLPVAVELLYRSEDRTDQHLPLLIWWAIEDKMPGSAADLLALLGKQEGRDFWKQPLALSVLAERLGRRLLAAGPNGYGPAAELLRVVPSGEPLSLVVRGMAKAFEGQRLPSVPPPLQAPLARRWAEQPGSADFLRLAVRLGSEPAYQTVLQRAADPATSEADRIRWLGLLAEARRADALPAFIEQFSHSGSDAVRLAALDGLAGFPDRKAVDVVLAAWPKLAGELRQRAQAVLLSRPESARAFLGLVERNVLQPKDVPLDQLRPVMAFNDGGLTKLVEKHWGKLAGPTAGEKQARISWLGMALNQGTGDAERGRAVFTRTCATCHTLFGEGGKIGPDLTSVDRKNRGYLLTNIVDPSGYIRPEFVTYNVSTLDGRRLSGVVSESSAETLTLVNVVNDVAHKTVVAKKDVEEMAASPVSLMPEKLLDTYADQDVRDLFAYLQLDRPPGKGPSAATGARLKVLLVSGSLEYRSDESLAAFQKHLESNYPVECARAFRKADDDLPGLEGLETCDVALFFTRRLTIGGRQLERVKKYARAGKPIVAVRTASHGFQNWLEMDKDVLGGNYQNHYPAGQSCAVEITKAGSDHPVLRGVQPFKSGASLYRNPNLPADDLVLMTGTIPGHTEPVAWVREQRGGRVFYTSLGHPEDFKEPGFVRVLANALFWTARREAPGR